MTSQIRLNDPRACPRRTSLNSGLGGSARAPADGSRAAGLALRAVLGGQRNYGIELFYPTTTSLHVSTRDGALVSRSATCGAIRDGGVQWPPFRNFRGPRYYTLPGPLDLKVEKACMLDRAASAVPMPNPTGHPLPNRVPALVRQLVADDVLFCVSKAPARRRHPHLRPNLSVRADSS